MSIDFIDTDRSSAADAGDGLRLGLPADRVSLPGDTSYDEQRMPWNVAIDQRPAAVAVPRTAAEVSAVVRAAADAGLRVAPAEHRPQRRSPGRPRARRRRRRPHLGDEPRDLRPDARHRARRGRHRLGAGRQRRGRARPGRPARLLPRRRHRRLQPRGRHRLVRPQARPGHQQPHRRRARDRRRHAGAGDRRGERGALLGAARWRRQLRRRHRPGVPQLPHRDGVRRDAAVGRRRTRSRCSASGAPGRPTAPDAISTSFRILRLPPMPDLPPFLQGRSVVVIDGAVLGSDDEGASMLRGPARAAPRARHVRPGAGRVAGAAAHGPRGPVAVRLRLGDARLAAGGRGGRLPRGRRPRRRRPRC